MTLDEFLKKIREEAYHSADLGAKFERFVKQYLQSPSYTGVHFTDVWLWSEFPYQHGHDVGIDLVARDSFGDFTAVQCKCYQPGTAVSKEDVDTFLSASGKTFYVEGRPTQFVQRILISTNDNWSANAEDAIKLQNPPVTRIGLALLRKTIEDAGTFDFEKGRAIIKRFDDLPHQTEAINDVLKGFETADRGQLIMACGTGKTFTALRIAEELKCKTVLFMVPSISLLSQSLRVWAQQAKDEIATLAVCSDSKADREEGDIPVCDLGFPATTSTDRLVKYGLALKFKPPKGMTVVFSTYQSVDAVSEAQQSGAFGTFDLIVCDEAHRTTGATFEGTQQSNFTKIHSDENVRGKRRLYMTATPRVYGENAKKRAEDEFIELASMDDEKVYGREFHHLSFSAAVGQDLLSDYKVQILAVSEEDIKAYGLRDYDGDGTIDNVDDVGKWIGCWKAFNKKLVAADMEHLGSDRAPMRSAVAFSSSIRDSKTFTLGFNKLVETFAGTDGLRPAAVHHVDGTMNALVRGNELDWLRRGNDPGNTECRILSNAKCLSEGVDVPGLDAIAFL
ncbi:MAG: DEAD/DEAH box helicase family protein, partial [Kiritimatiellae bacterium]|nr:DEAD/DEAH box helicase family protein [Kiritimatiellia bacterium]